MLTTNQCKDCSICLLQRNSNVSSKIDNGAGFLYELGNNEAEDIEVSEFSIDAEDESFINAHTPILFV